MTANPPINLWSSADHVRDYLERADSISHRTEGEAAMLEFIPEDAHRILDLGTGDGRLLALVKDHLVRKNLVKNDLVKNDLTRKDLIKRDLRRKSAKPDFMEHPRPETEAVAIDFSLSMLEAARQRFAADSSVTVISHNLDEPLTSLGPNSLGKFDAVISCFAIHHLVHERKRALHAEIYDLLNPGGVFCNLEHVSSPTPRLHEDFLHRIGYTVETEDPSNKLLDVETQLQWLRELGFADVDCHWKWRELALLAGRMP
jgi:tRNA (cmo5U34)-methyltransferase